MCMAMEVSTGGHSALPQTAPAALSCYSLVDQNEGLVMGNLYAACIYPSSSWAHTQPAQYLPLILVFA